MNSAPCAAPLLDLYRGLVQPGRPLLFLDFDDVICVNNPYGGYDVFLSPSERPADLWELLFAEEPKRLMLEIAREFSPRIVITTSWLRLLDRPGFESLFRLTGLAELVTLMHPAWDAPQARGATRWRAIQTWLEAHYEGEPVVVVDDELSGTGLAESPLHRVGRVVICKVGVGFTRREARRVRLLFQSGG